MLLPHGVPKGGSGFGLGYGNGNNGGSGSSSGGRHRGMNAAWGGGSGRSVWWIIFVSAVPSFFLGTLTSLITCLECSSNNGSSGAMSSSQQQQLDPANGRRAASMDSNNMCYKQVVEAKALAIQQTEARVRAEFNSNKAGGGSTGDHMQDIFPKDSMGKFLVGMARTTKNDFVKHLDLGVPLEASETGASEVMILYGRSNAMPEVMETEYNKNQLTVIHNMTTAEATKRCDMVNVILNDHSGTRKQCLAIVPQYESYHIQKWMRIHRGTGKLDSTLPLQMVSRGQQTNGKDQFTPPDMEQHTAKHWDMLRHYFDNLDAVLGELRPLLAKIADPTTKTVVVMVCNFGQSELLMNFACSARARGFDTSNVIVFTTDPETTELATSLGLTAYFDHRNFGDIPTDAAKRYGDRKFVAMMMAKVICVQLVSMLGYNFLFQDVDIVWFKNPIQYFTDPNQPGHDYDIFFQDDGGHSVRYAPYSANSGFYFVRYNPRTRHFLTSLLMAGDLILKTNSHQQALIATLNEHVSLFGLTVKVLSRDMEEFPGGYQFHQKSGQYMKSFFAGHIHPYIFHMSWTLNKDNKLLFFRQLGEWFVHDTCIQRNVTDIVKDPAAAAVTATDLRPHCCAAEPLISCHYRDKPSKIPCKDSPPIDKGKKSFW